MVESHTIRTCHEVDIAKSEGEGCELTAKPEFGELLRLAYIRWLMKDDLLGLYANLTWQVVLHCGQTRNDWSDLTRGAG